MSLVFYNYLKKLSLITPCTTIINNGTNGKMFV